MIRAFLRRHRLLAVPLLFMLGGLLLPWRQTSADSQPSLLPAAVIMKQAYTIEQGVQIEWLEGQKGIHQLKNYIVEKNKNNDFIPIAKVPAVSHHYIDSTGKAGDMYRIIVEAAGSPIVHSPASEPISAAEQKLGTTVLEASAAAPLFAVNSDNALRTSQELQKNIAQLFTDVTASDSSYKIADKLTILQGYQQQLLTLIPRLSAAERQEAAGGCEGLPIFEATMHKMPEYAQLDAMIVQASCHAIQDSGE